MTSAEQLNDYGQTSLEPGEDCFALSLVQVMQCLHVQENPSLGSWLLSIRFQGAAACYDSADKDVIS